MKAVVNKAFGDVENPGKRYEAGETVVFKKERAEFLAQKGFVTIQDEPAATETVVTNEPKKGKVITEKKGGKDEK